MTIDFQGLLAVAKATEERPLKRFDMSTWHCGTSACMIGSFCDAYPMDKLQCNYIPIMGNLRCTKAISKRFGITEREAQWIFTECARTKRMARLTRYRSLGYITKQQALSRLYKFIYYKLHKQEMTLEVARRVDGNKAALLASTVV